MRAFAGHLLLHLQLALAFEVELTHICWVVRAGQRLINLILLALCQIASKLVVHTEVGLANYNTLIRR